MPPTLTESDAGALDASDPLDSLRGLFHIPPSPAHSDGRESLYFTGNSLGLQPKSLRDEVKRELDDWAALGVEGHFKDRGGWFAYHESCREMLARLVGARSHEVVAMNSLTVNLHLMMVSFYRPAGRRRAILMDWPCFPSDVYAAKSQLRYHGVPESEGLIWLRPREGEATLPTEDVLATIEREGDRIALVLLAGVNYATGQFMEIERITAAARANGCAVGWDLAHAAGNVQLHLHDSGADFAVWCSYKYLNSGPGAVAGCFVHERHTKLADAATRRMMPRFEGWWGNDPSTRFAMGPEFDPVASADAWQLSNPPILSLVPLRVSLEIFDRVGMAALREKSLRLTAYLESVVTEASAASAGRFRIITPSDPERRGCQLSIEVAGDAGALLRALRAGGAICDFRRPNVIRVAPTPLYNTFRDCWEFGRLLSSASR
jgi:kynureninase